MRRATFLANKLSAVLGVNVSFVAVKLRRSAVEVRGLEIGNDMGQWSTPFALRLGRFRFVAA